jgi:hypothetical protein
MNRADGIHIGFKTQQALAFDLPRPAFSVLPPSGEKLRKSCVIRLPKRSGTPSGTGRELDRNRNRGPPLVGPPARGRSAKGTLAPLEARQARCRRTCPDRFLSPAFAVPRAARSTAGVADFPLPALDAIFSRIYRLQNRASGLERNRDALMLTIPNEPLFISSTRSSQAAFRDAPHAPRPQTL